MSKRKQPFPCDECSSRFRTRSLLNHHKRIHARKSAMKTTPDPTFGTSSKRVAQQLTTKDEVQESIVEDRAEELNCDRFAKKSSSTSVDRKSLVSDGIGISLNEEEQASKPHIIGEFVAVEMNDHQTETNIDHNLDVIDGSGKDISKKLSVERKVRPRRHEKPSFSCCECNEKFGAESRLKIHQRMHTGEFRFICDECGSRLLRQDSLSRHKRLHNGEKRFFCEKCGCGFSREFNILTRAIMREFR